MALSCGAKCMKWLLFIFNFIIFICGALLLAIGIWWFVDPEFRSYTSQIFPPGSDTLLETLAIIITTVGAFTFLAGFLGCCGACRESSCMLCTYVFLLVVVLLVVIAAAVLGVIFRIQIANEEEKTVKDAMYEQLSEIGKPDDANEVSKSWHMMQVRLQCCGVQSYRDYAEPKYYNSSDSNNPIPITCCKLKNDDATKPEAEQPSKCYDEFRAKKVTWKDAKQIHASGCYEQLIKWVESKTLIIILVGVAIAVLVIIAIIFACCVRKEVLAGEQYA